MWLLVLSTATHYIASLHIPLLHNYTSTSCYRNTILISTTLSVAWHAAGEPAGLLMLLDYGGAAVWFVQDVWLGPRTHMARIILLNIAVLLLNLAANYTTHYNEYHSAWHIVSAAKCVYIARLIYHEG